jgi:tellurium resistance protein TerD
MGIELSKGSRFDLEKHQPGMQKALVAIGWDFSERNFDADLTALMITETGKLLDDHFFVFYNNLNSPDGGIKHTGDNRTGMGDGDDEVLLVHFPSVDPRIKQIVVSVSIHQAELRRQTFGMLSNFFFRIHDVERNEEVVRYDLKEFGQFTEMIIGRLIRMDHGWIFEASTVGSNKGLSHIINQFA